MRPRLIALAAAAGIAITALPSHAATAPKPQITDPAGDANGVNDQGFGVGVPPSTATPTDVSAADITGIALQTTFRTKKVKNKKVRVPTGSTITVNFSSAPDTNTFYAVTFASTGACKSVNLVYDANSIPLYAQDRGICEDTTTGSDIGGPVARVVGKSIVWTLPLSAFPVKTTFSDIGAQTLTGQIPAVTLDETDSSDVTFTVGK